MVVELSESSEFIKKSLNCKFNIWIFWYENYTSEMFTKKKSR